MRLNRKLFLLLLLLILGARGQLWSIRNALPMRHRNVLRDVRDCIVWLDLTCSLAGNWKENWNWNRMKSHWKGTLCVLSIAMPARWEGEGRERGRVVTLSPANLGFKSATLIGPHTQRLRMGLRWRSRSRRSVMWRWRNRRRARRRWKRRGRTRGRRKGRRSVAYTKAVMWEVQAMDAFNSISSCT